MLQFDPVVGDSTSEKTRNLGILEKIGKAKEVLDTTKAANRLNAEKERSVAWLWSSCLCPNLSCSSNDWSRDDWLTKHSK